MVVVVVVTVVAELQYEVSDMSDIYDISVSPHILTSNVNKVG